MPSWRRSDEPPGESGAERAGLGGAPGRRETTGYSRDTTGGALPDQKIRVRLNGKDREIPAGLTVRELLTSLELRPELVVVELNREILGRDAFVDQPVREGDTLEVVHFVGGG